MTDRVPLLSPDFRVRSAEPIAYHRKTSTIFHMNDDGDRVLRLIDGRRSVMEIAIALCEGDVERAGSLLPACERFLDALSEANAIDWITE